MNCPECGEKTKVLDTRKLTKIVVRVRKCATCGKVFETVEKRTNDGKA